MVRLIVFLAVAPAIYAGMHAVVYLGARPFLALRGLSGWPVLVLAALLVTAPITTRVLDRLGLEGAARGTAWIGYLWLGFIFLAFSLFVALFLWNGIFLLAGRLIPSLGELTWHDSNSAASVLLLALLIGGYGFFEASHLRQERIRIETDKLPPGRERLRILQISDLHLGLMLRERTLSRVLDQIRSLEPDLLVATGDLVDAQLNHIDRLAELFADFQPSLGKYAVTGNHEVYAGLPQSLEFLHRAGFRVLRQEEDQPTPGLRLVGVDDPAAATKADEAALLRQAPAEGFTLLLKHRPTVDPESAGLFDLQLSGHTHRGQIAPFNLVTALAYPRQDGLYLLAGGARLYSSRGTGTWGPPIRVLSPPEVTLIELVRPGTD